MKRICQGYQQLNPSPARGNKPNAFAGMFVWVVTAVTVAKMIVALVGGCLPANTSGCLVGIISLVFLTGTPNQSSLPPYPTRALPPPAKQISVTMGN